MVNLIYEQIRLIDKEMYDLIKKKEELEYKYFSATPPISYVILKEITKIQESIDRFEKLRDGYLIMVYSFK